LLVKVPEPVPLFVFVVNAMVGFGFVLQQTPRAVIAGPPVFVISPPEVAEVVVMEEVLLVVSVAKFPLSIVTVIWLP
jgi:hypothetical protein